MDRMILSRIVVVCISTENENFLCENSTQKIRYVRGASETYIVFYLAVQKQISYDYNVLNDCNLFV